MCPRYIDIRKQLLPRYYTSWPSIRKFVSLMKNDRTIKLAAFKIRKLCIEQNEEDFIMLKHDHITCVSI